MDGQARFHAQIPGQTTAPDPLGVWQTVPAPSGRSPEPDGEQVTHWQAFLPEDPARAGAILAQQAGRLTSAEWAVPWAAQRLEAFVQSAPAGGPVPAASYAAAPAGLLLPERELEAWLLAERGAEEYGRLDDLRAGLQQAAQEVGAFSGQLRQALAQFAAVETTVGGQMLARTRVSWLGHAHVVWRGDVDREQASLHRRTLALALASRQAWMRLGLVFAAGAARLATLAPTPLAIPAAYRFVTQVLAEVQQLRKTLKRE